MENKIFPNTTLQVFTIIFLSFILGSPILFLERYYFTDFSQDAIKTIYYIVFFLIIISVVHLINFRYKRRITYSFNINNSISLLPLLAVILFTFQAGLNPLMSNVLNFAFGFKNNLTNPFDSIVILIGALILAPILEEIFFRGSVLKGLLTSYSARKAIIISAIIFAAFHLNPSQIFGGLVLGLFFGWVYYKTKSLGLTILLHFSANLFGLISEYMRYKLSSITNDSIFNIYGSMSLYIILICLVLFAFTFHRLYQKWRLSI
ncbi:MAG: type II CAAX endopeptidase family protein [Daejeonella sp.]